MADLNRAEQKSTDEAKEEVVTQGNTEIIMIKILSAINGQVAQILRILKAQEERISGGNKPQEEEVK